MSEIQRYEIQPYMDLALPRDHGKWVKYEDHAAIVQQLAERNTVLAAEVRAWRAQRDSKYTSDCHVMFDMWAAIEKARKATDAANAMEGT
jgi:hypothetical protein